MFSAVSVLPAARPAPSPAPAAFAPAVAGSTSETLRVNTNLWINTAHTMYTTFEAGTTVTLRSDGSVSAGTLVYNFNDYVNSAHSIVEEFRAEP